MPPGQDQYVKLPDGSYVHVPGTATPAQLSQLKEKLSTQFADPLKTGKGMEERAEQQARPAQKTGLPGGGQPSYAAMSIENSPSGADPHNPGNPNLNAIPTSERESVNNRLATVAGITTPMTGGAMEGLPGVLRAGRSVLTGAAGATVGAGGGGEIGGLFGPTGRQVGAAIGGIGGGIVGGGMGAGLERNPATNKINPLPMGLQRAIPDWMVPGKIPDEELAMGNFMSKGYKSAIPEPAPPAGIPQGELDRASFMNRGYKSAMPVPETPKAGVMTVERPAVQGFVPKVASNPVTEFAERQAAARPVVQAPQPKPGTFTVERPQTQGFIPRVATDPTQEFAARQSQAITASKAAQVPQGTVAGTRSLVLTPSEAQSESVMQRIAKQRASERGMQFAGGMTPREGRSVPKAAMKMPDEEYPGPRESMKFPDDEESK